MAETNYPKTAAEIFRARVTEFNPAFQGNDSVEITCNKLRIFVDAVLYPTSDVAAVTPYELGVRIALLVGEGLSLLRLKDTEFLELGAAISAAIRVLI